MRHPLGVDHLLPDGRVRGAAADGEVVALHYRPPAVDAAGADHDVGGEEVLDLAVVAVGRPPGERARLVEAAGIEEPLDPLADGEPPGGVLALDPLLAAHLARQRFAAAKLVELGLPGHRDLGSRS